MRDDRDPFQTAVEFDIAHAEMLELLDAEGIKSLAPQLEPFIVRGVRSGGYLFDLAERRACQGILDFWATQAYSADLEIPRPVLDKPDRALLPLLADSSCPYLGLKAFDESDKCRYFGREDEVARLAAKVERETLVIVTGASGSGKSSLVLAGLLPKLKEKAGPGGDGWHFPPALVPGNAPLRRLATCLLPEGASGAQIEAEARALLADPTHLLKRLDGFAKPSVLIVDQFEEVFTLQTQENKAEFGAFVDNLLHVAGTGGTGHRLVLTMRKNVESKLGTYPLLYDRYRDAVFAVFELAQNGLRAAIEEPAKAVGLKFQPGVVDAIVGSMVGEENNLPLLQFALMQLWEARVGNIITREALDRLGNVKHAIPVVAERLYQTLSDEQQKAAKSVFVRLALVGDNATVYRRRVARGELLQLEKVEPENVKAVLKVFCGANLLRVTGTGPELSDDDMVEVVHESLLRNWRLIDNILTDAVEERDKRNFLRRMADDWRANKYDDGSLLGGTALKEVEKKFAKHDDLSEVERKFIDASLALERRRLRNNRLRLVAALVCAVVLAVALVFVAMKNNAFFSRELAAQAIKIGPRDPTLGLLLAQHALEKSKTPEALGAFYALTKMAQTRPRINLTSKQVGTVDALSLTPDGLHLLTAGGGKLRLWSLDDASVSAGTLLKRTLDVIEGEALLVTSSRDGRRIAVATSLTKDDLFQEQEFAGSYWDTGEGAKAALVKLDLGDGQPVGLEFNSDGSFIAAVVDRRVQLPGHGVPPNRGSQLRVWSTRATQGPPQVANLPGKALALSFGSTRDTIRILLENGQVQQVQLDGAGGIGEPKLVGGECEPASDTAVFAFSSVSYVRYGSPSICFNQFGKGEKGEGEAREELYGDAPVMSSDGQSVAMLQSFSKSIVVVSVGADTALRLPGAYDIRVRKEEQPWSRRRGVAHRNLVQLSDEGRRLASKRSDGSVSVYDLARPMSWPVLSEDDVAAPDGSAYAVEAEAGPQTESARAVRSISVRNFPKGDIITRLQGAPDHLFTNKEFSTDGRYFMVEENGFGEHRRGVKVSVIDRTNPGKIIATDARSWVRTDSDVLLVGVDGAPKKAKLLSTGKARTFSRPQWSRGVDLMVDRKDGDDATSFDVVRVAKGNFVELGKITVPRLKAELQIERTGKFLMVRIGSKERPMTALWSVGEDTIVRKKDIEGWYRAPMAHPDGKLIVASRVEAEKSTPGEAARTFIMDVESAVRTEVPHVVQVSPGGRYLVKAVAGSEGYQIVDAAAMERVFKVPGGQDVITGPRRRDYFAFSPDDTQLAAVYSESKVLTLYSLKDRRLKVTAEMPFDGIRGAAFLSNTNIAVSTEFNQEVIPADIKEWRIHAKEIIGGRRLTAAEWCEFLEPDCATDTNRQ